MTKQTLKKFIQPNSIEEKKFTSHCSNSFIFALLLFEYVLVSFCKHLFFVVKERENAHTKNTERETVKGGGGMNRRPEDEMEHGTCKHESA